jgi:precorrin-6A synthase
MIELYLVGIGMGNPSHLTGAAIEALQLADLILIPNKGEAKADLRSDICEKLLLPIPQITYFSLPSRDPKEPDYLKRVSDWHDSIASLWQNTILSNRPNGGKVELMIWGDPSLYDSSLRIAERLQTKDHALKIHVIPGVTAVQLLTAANRIPLNELGAPVTISTGRQLRDNGWPEGCETLVVMLDGETMFDALDAAKCHIP